MCLASLIDCLNLKIDSNTALYDNMLGMNPCCLANWIVWLYQQVKDGGAGVVGSGKSQWGVWKWWHRWHHLGRWRKRCCRWGTMRTWRAWSGWGCGGRGTWRESEEGVGAGRVEELEGGGLIELEGEEDVGGGLRSEVWGEWGEVVGMSFEVCDCPLTLDGIRRRVEGWDVVVVLGFGRYYCGFGRFVDAHLWRGRQEANTTRESLEKEKE